MKSNHGFTIVEAFLLLVAAVVIFALVQPMFSRRTHFSGHPQNHTYIRGIHTGMVLFAQNNRDYFPGLDTDGNIANKPIPASSGMYGTASTNGTNVSYRMAVLLRGSYFSPEYLISRQEIDPNVVTPELSVNMLPGQNYSYAMLNISQPDAPRNKEWRATNNSRAAVISDRNIGGPGSATSPATTTQSIHTEKGEGWRGSVCYNDNHAVFETSDLIKSEYDEQGEIAADGLFSDKEVTHKGIAGADAAMVFKDNVSYSVQTAK